jgi:hypothetical protein
MPPKPPSCAICSSRIPLSSIRTDAEAQHPRFGQHRPGQQTILCAGCGRLLHTACVDEANTTIAGHHLWFSNMRMRAFLQEHGLVGHQVAFCKDCHEELGEQILDNYKMMERFDEGARFLEEFGRVDEAFALLAEIKG